VLAILGLAEGAARIGYRGRWPYYLVWDEDVLWRPRPGWSGLVRGDVHATFDDLGLREERDWRALPGDRVLVLGDSVAFGYYLEQEQTIARRLEARWPETGAPGSLVGLTAGIEGHGPEQEVRTLGRLLPAVSPRVVVWVLCLRNDVSVEPLAQALARDTALNPGQKSLAARDPTLAGLLDRSALAFFFMRGVAKRERDEVRAETAKAAGPPGSGLLFSTLEELVRLPPPYLEAELATLRGHLARGVALARERGARVILVLSPDESLLSGRVSPAVVARITAIGAELQVPTIDLLPLLRDAAHGPLLRERDGVHPTAEGADVIAAAIAREIAREGGYPPR
jgi:lysophospholipase L1-like esterase